MSRTPKAGDADEDFATTVGTGGETHQHVPRRGPHDTEAHLTTNQGIRVSDNQNSLKSGARGPALLEDFVLREKIFHFDHEHARGSAAHGYFKPTTVYPTLPRNGLHSVRSRF